MKGTYGVGLYSVQPGGKGVPVLPATSLGIMENLRTRRMGGVEPLRGIGSANPIELAAGMAQATVGFDISAVQLPAFLRQAIRVANQLPWLTMGIGYRQGADEYAHQIQDCKINRLGLRCENRGYLSASLEMVGGKVTSGGTGVIDLPDMSFPTEYAYKYYEATWSAGEILSFAMDVSHGLDPDAVIAGPATVRDPNRIWDYLEEGDEEITGTIVGRTIDAPFGADPGVHDDCPAPTNVTLVFDSLCATSPSNVLVVSLTGVMVTDDEFRIPRGDNIVFEMPFLATGFNIY